MWKTTALALLTATIMAGSMAQSASAHSYGNRSAYGNGYGYDNAAGYDSNYDARYRDQQNKEYGARQELGSSGYRGGCNFGILLQNGSLNPGMPANWVHDPITQAWLDPNSAQAELACVHQAQINAQQQGNVTPPRRYGYGQR